jgi:hypothetical protein
MQSVNMRLHEERSKTFELRIYFAHEYNFICSLNDNVIMPARVTYNLSFNVERSIADICDTLNVERNKCDISIHM